jgi:glucosamine-6-phosphate deaminase
VGDSCLPPWTLAKETILRVVVLETAKQVNDFAADMVCALVELRQKQQQPTVLGLATGGTPLGLYSELITRHQAGRISFSNVDTFNLDEYVGVAPSSPCSYHYYMLENLFRHVDIDLTRTHVPQTYDVDLSESASRFELQIEQAGGIDLQILGIGVDGHIGFNEIGSSLVSRTRVKTLTHQTRSDNARYFESLEHVPRTALTMGIATILESQSILLMAHGAGKAQTIRNTIEGPITASVPASALQLHPDVTIVLDEAAASSLANREYYLESERNRGLLSRSS